MKHLPIFQGEEFFTEWIQSLQIQMFLTDLPK